MNKRTRTESEIRGELRELTNTKKHCVRFKIFRPGNRGFDRQNVTGPAGTYLTEKGVEKAIAEVANKVEQMYPNQDYKLVPTTEGYNFVWLRAWESA